MDVDKGGGAIFNLKTIPRGENGGYNEEF